MKKDPSAPSSRASVTITEVAAAANVSKSTVSLFLQGSPLIARETAERVRQAALALGYVYNRRAADLRRQSTKVIGIVINDLANPFFAELLVGMEKRLVEAGYISLMAHTDESVGVQERVLTSMREYNAAGLILCPAFGTPDALLKAIRRSGTPLVVTVRPPEDPGYDFVGTDHEHGTHAATFHLIQQGHRRIVFLGRIGGGAVYEQRRAGYLRAMTEQALRVMPEWIVDISLTREGGRNGIRRVLAMQPRPTAAVCYNDVVAFGALSELGEHGLTAGRDFAITGFDGVIAAAHTNPPLTTVETSPGELGAAAAVALLLRLSSPEAPPIRRVTEPKLVVRQSSGPPARANT
ncbi:MAG: LacI family DNA-binding transcriptional regulator [Burkholderiales bacterium]